MYALFAQIARFLPTKAVETTGEARHLMESAEARAGHDSHEAQDLRIAACAFLSVVR